LKGFVDGNSEWNFYAFLRPESGAVAKIATIDIGPLNPALPVQRSNQLSYSETVVEL
jgi:hypothetical protein